MGMCTIPFHQITVLLLGILLFGQSWVSPTFPSVVVSPAMSAGEAQQQQDQEAGTTARMPQQIFAPVVWQLARSVCTEEWRKWCEHVFWTVLVEVLQK